MAYDKKLISGILIVIMLLGVLTFTGVLPQFSLVTVSEPFKTTDGKTYQTAEILVYGNEQIVTLLTNDYESSEGKQGAPDNITVTFKPKNQICTYVLTPRPEPYISFTNTRYDLWKVYYPDSPTLSAKVGITSSDSSDSKTVETNLDGTSIESSVQLKEKDGVGILTATTKGIMGGNKVCPDTSGIVVLDNKGTPKVVSEAGYISYRDSRIRDLFLSGACLNPANIGAVVFKTGACYDNIMQVYSDITTGSNIPTASNFDSFRPSPITQYLLTFQNDKTSLVGIATPGRFGAPAFIITADKEYVDSFMYEKPPSEPPEIKSLVCGDVSESVPNTVKATLYNPNTEEATFRYYITASRGSITPDSSIAIDADGEEQILFSYITPSITTQTGATVTLKACPIGQFAGDCVEKTASCTIKNDGGLVVPPQPEPQPTSCSERPNTHSEDGSCVCDDGFVKRYDDAGNWKCQSPSEEIPDWVIYGLAGVAVLLVGYALLSKPRRRR